MDPSVQSPGMVLLWALLNFLKMFFVSALIGVLFALISAIVSKYNIVASGFRLSSSA